MSSVFLVSLYVFALSVSSIIRLFESSQLVVVARLGLDWCIVCASNFNKPGVGSYHPAVTMDTRLSGIYGNYNTHVHTDNINNTRQNDPIMTTLKYGVHLCSSQHVLSHTVTTLCTCTHMHTVY